MDYKLHKKPKGPNNPKPNNLSIIPKNKDKKLKNLELKRRANELKEKLLKSQNSNLVTKDSNKLSFSERKNWKGTVDIGEVPKFSAKDQLENLNYEFQAYNNQEKKFKKIVINIDKGKENFYSDDSRSLFNSYVDVIKILKKNLKIIQKTLKKEK